MVFGVFLTQKSTDSVSLVQLLRIVFSVFTGKYTRFLVTTPLLAWGGVRNWPNSIHLPPTVSVGSIPRRQG